ncbi:MAG: UTRA domain-containing protein, partial [Oscillospiraceae bacterium]|nr:UTRA domain-containing protein [Oscillospiraceae bacterium]
VVGSEIIPADKKRQSRLALAEGDRVYRLKRIYYADGEPLNFTTVYLPYKLFPGVESHDFARNSLYKVLEDDYGVKITRAERTLEAVLAYEEVQEYLNIRSGVPLILFQCITYGEIKGKEYPIETFKCYYRSDRFKFCVNQVR